MRSEKCNIIPTEVVAHEYAVPREQSLEHNEATAQESACAGGTCPNTSRVAKRLNPTTPTPAEPLGVVAPRVRVPSLRRPTDAAGILQDIGKALSGVPIECKGKWWLTTRPVKGTNDVEILMHPVTSGGTIGLPDPDSHVVLVCNTETNHLEIHTEITAIKNGGMLGAIFREIGPLCPAGTILEVKDVKNDASREIIEHFVEPSTGDAKYTGRLDAWLASNDPLAQLFVQALAAWEGVSPVEAKKLLRRDREKKILTNFAFQFFTTQGSARASGGFRVTSVKPVDREPLPIPMLYEVKFEKTDDPQAFSAGKKLRGELLRALADAKSKSLAPAYAVLFNGTELAELGLAPPTL